VALKKDTVGDEIMAKYCGVSWISERLYWFRKGYRDEFQGL